VGKVTFDISMSLDGFMTAAGQTSDAPMGQGGMRLVDWAFGADERDRAVLTDGIASIGAVIAGRRTYESSVFEGLGDHHLQLENRGSVQTPSATHLRFGIAR
jgi:dihydrofolate reductase